MISAVEYDINIQQFSWLPLLAKDNQPWLCLWEWWHMVHTTRKYNLPSDFDLSWGQDWCHEGENNIPSAAG